MGSPARSGRCRAIALVIALAVLASGCWGYNRSAKRGAYVLDTVLIAGGGGLIALGFLDPPRSCADIEMDTGVPNPGCHDPVAGPVSGTMVAGAMLVLGGLVAIVVNATRRNVKTSR
jgi:hypothetical protein